MSEILIYQNESGNIKVDVIFEDENITCVNAIGIAFSGKNCFITCKKLK